MTARRLTAYIVLIGALAVPVSANAQLFGGITAARADKIFGGTSGMGGVLGVDFPILPLDAFVAGTWFFPDCDGCDLKGWSLGANLRLPIPMVRPYLTGGMTWRDVGLGDETINPLAENDDSGVFAGAGVDLAIASFRLFLEGRYEFLDGDLGQAVVRMGVMLR